MVVLIIDCGSKDLPDLISSISNKDYKIIVIDEAKNENFDFYEAIIISGSPVNLTEKADDCCEKFFFLKDINVPLLGICFGHQMIGYAWGAKIIKGQNYVRCDNKIEILKKDPLFNGIEDFVFQEDHGECINLPPNFIHLATSKKTKVEAFKHPERICYGVQFHPEISGESGKKLINNFLEIANGLR